MEDTLGKRIMQHRKRLNMTQDQLAEKLNVTAQAVSKWENDQSCPDINMLPRLAELFGCTIDELMGVAGDVHTGEVVTDKDADNEALSGSNHFEFRYDSRRGALGFACWVVALGVLMLLDAIFHTDIGLWGLAWPSFLVIAGLFWGKRFSFFRLGCVLFGGYFLLDHFHLIPFTPGSEIIWPVLIVLFGLSLLLDSLRKPKKHRVTVHNRAGQHHEQVHRCDVQDDHFHCENAFSTNDYHIRCDHLISGTVENSFGEVTVDLSGVSTLAPDCDLSVESAFGKATILVPARFAVRLVSESAFGSVETAGQSQPQPEGTMTIDAEASFGSILVRYI